MKTAEQQVRDYEIQKRMAAKEKRIARKKSQKVQTKARRRNSPTKNRVEWGWIYPDGREVCDFNRAAWAIEDVPIEA